MVRVNDNFKELPGVYLFTRISRRIAEYKEKGLGPSLIRMDIGDISGPIPGCVARYMQEAVNDLETKDKFHGYGPEQGYNFLREAIRDHDYKSRVIDISTDEIFVSDGAKCDLGNLGDIFSRDLKIAVMNPSYPAYIDDNVIDGRAGHLEGSVYSNVEYLKCSAKDGYMPSLPREHVDIIYLCSPNNPTGTVLPREELRKWVDYARKEGSIIIFDSAYESYIRDNSLPRSIYEIENSKEVAIEVRSFSKSGGFTGIRCGYSVVPKELKGKYSDGKEVSLNSLWSRRQTTKFNGASYISQRGALALYTAEGRDDVRKMTDYYLENARLLRAAFESAGWETVGATDSPYVWTGNPKGIKSEDVFERLLTETGVTCTPGTGFGSEGEGFIRLTGFSSREKTEEAIKRIEKIINTF